MDAGKLLANFDLVIAAPGGVARVREMILQLAVRGQLVPQDPSDGAAAIVLENARREKAKIKVAKSMPPVDAPSAPYSLPQNWEWMRIGDAGRVVGGGTPKTSIRDYWEGDEMFSWITPADLNKQSRYVEKGRRDISRAGLENSSANILPVGSVVFSIRAPIGYVGIVSNPLATNQGFKSCVPYIQNMSDYIWLFLKAFAPSIDAAASGTTFRELSGKEFSLIPIAVPPIAEQKRIVDKVDELMALCDELDEKKQHSDNTHKALQSSALNTLATAATPAATSKAWIRIHDHWPILLSTPESIATLRQLILSLAFRGRLTEREDCDGVSGADVAEAARSEISTLVQSKAARKGAELSPISPAEIPHEIPESWVWVRLGSVCIYNSGERIAGADIPPGAWLLELEDIQKTTSHLLNRVKARERKPKSTKSSFEAGDILYGKLRPYLDKVLVADESGYCTTEIIPLRPLGGIIPDFLRWAVKRPDFIAYAVKNSYGINLPRLGTTDGQNALLPIPPLAEQKCIAAKIDELMALCEALERGLAEKAEVGQRYGEAATRPLTEGGIKT